MGRVLLQARASASARAGLPRWVWPGFALVLIAAPLVFTSSLGLSLLNQIGIAIIVCLSYNILLGQGGMLSFGHAVYVGIGALLSMHTLGLVERGLPVPVSLVPLVGGMASLLLAALLGWVSTRKSGTPFAMITLGVGELVSAMSLMFPGFFGGEGGISGNRVAGPSPFGLTYGPQIEVYGLIALYTFACTALMFAFTRTPLGRMLNAVRDNPERAAFVGYDPRQVRYRAFMVAALFAGIAGGLAALHFEIVTSEAVSSYRSGSYLLFTYLGGIGFFFGPVIGAVLMVLANVLLSELTRAWLLYLGLIFLLLVMHAPGGLAGLVMAHMRVARSGEKLGGLATSYGWLLLALLVALSGTGAMVEMLYQLQLRAALGSRVGFLGLTLDAAAAGNWLAAALVSGVGWFALELARRRFMRQWHAVHEGAGIDAQRRGIDP